MNYILTLESLQLIPMLKSTVFQIIQVSLHKSNLLDPIILFLWFERPSQRKADPDCIGKKTQRMLDGKKKN